MKFKSLILIIAACLMSTVTFAAKNTTTYKPAATTIAPTNLTHRVGKIMQHYFPNAPFVLASPYLSGTPRFDGLDLITNWPSINEDLFILKTRQTITHELIKRGIPLPKRPLIDISGYVEGEGLVNNAYDGTTKGDINLSGAEISILADIDRWASAFVGLTYDNSSPMQGYRSSNSNLKVDRGFITLGNLDKSPLYVTVGQMYAPFGTYASYMISNPYTKIIGRAKVRAALLGFSKYGIYASTYVFAGDSFIHGNNTINNFGFNLGYAFNSSNFNANIGTGYIQNIADASGAQDTSAASGYFQGFAYDSTPAKSGGKAENLQHQIPALDFHAKFRFLKHYNLIGEYITALRGFSSTDLSYNGHGARLSALNTEAAVNFKFFNRPSTFGVGYEHTWEALGVNVPEQSVVSEASISLWRDTVEKIEYRHDINYSSSDTSAGGGSFPMSTTGPHKERNVVTLHVDFYF